MFAVVRLVPGLHHLLHAGRRSDHILQPVHGAALHIHAAEQRYLRLFLCRLQQSVRLPRRLDIAGKQDDAARLQRLERGAQAARKLLSVKAKGEQLTGQRA